MEEMKTNILPGQSDLEQLRSEVISRAQDKKQPKENLIKAKNDLFMTPFLTKEKIEAFYKNDIIAYELLIDKLSRNNMTECFWNIMANIKEQGTFNEFETYYNPNYYDFFVDKTKFVDGFIVNEQEFRDLMRFISGISYDGHGKTEILFNLLFKNTTLIKSADLFIDDMHIELKGSIGNKNGGMIKGNKQIKHPRIIMETIKNTLKNDIDINILNECTTSGIKGFNNLVNVLRENNVKDKFIIHAIALGVFSQFFDLQYFNQFMMFIDLIEFNPQTLGEQLFRLHGVCAIISYKLENGWNRLCITDVESGKYVVVNISDADKIEDVSWRHYKTLYDNTNIIFRAGPSTTAKDERAYVSTIYCV